MRACLLLALVGMVAAPAVETAVAEPTGSHFELTPFAGYTVFDGQLRSNGRPLRDDLYLGGRVSFQLNSWVGLEAAGGFTPTKEDATAGGDVDFVHASGSLLLTPWAGRLGGPYLFVGGGTNQVHPAGGSTESHGGLELGGGLRLWITDFIGLRVEMRQLYYTIPTQSGDLNINHLIVGGGLVLALGGKPRDTDGDGVPDRKDRCPDTPLGATVDANGCPKDSDGDQVLDGIDKCPDTPKGCTVDQTGCPKDDDGDGVCNGLDQCAETPKGATV
ncbi:MAG TPA: outer membrane beta-barrel protein, partial [Candidatus Eisenbacteria bacterium]